MTKAHNILIIEDDENFSEFLIRVLAQLNYNVTLAPDGMEGLKKAQSGGYDLIIIDLMLPRLSGIEILRTLKKYPPKKANGPIIILSNVTEESEIYKARDLGITAYLDKTKYNPQQLVESIEQYLGL